MRKCKVAAVAITVAVLSCSVSATSQEQKQRDELPDPPDLSVYAFMTVCSDIGQDPSRYGGHEMACLGYIHGVVDGIAEETSFAHAAANSEQPTPFCLPEKVRKRQLVRVVYEYIQNHPEEEAQERAADLIIKALQEAYPCTP